MLIEADQNSFFFLIFFSSLLTQFNYTGNKTEIKKYNIKGQKDTQEEKKGK